MTTIAEAATRTAQWWEGDGALDRFEALTAATEADEWGAHELCSLTACRAPLHPGPCKGWKHTLHLVSPGAWKSLEQARVDKLNNRRLAKVAQLKANGQRVPPALLKPIMPRQHPGGPPPGWTPGHIAPGQPAADAQARVDRTIAQVGQKAKAASGPAHHAGQALAPQAAQAKAAAPQGPARRPGSLAPVDQDTVLKALADPQHTELTKVAVVEALTGNDFTSRFDAAGQSAVLKFLDSAAQSHDAAVARRAEVARRRLAPPAAAPAPATPGKVSHGAATKTIGQAAGRLSPAQDAAAKASTRGTGKAKLAAYQGLDKAGYDGLDDATKHKIDQDLKLMHGKFLDPKKQAEVTAVRQRLGLAAAPAASPSAPAKAVTPSRAAFIGPKPGTAPDLKLAAYEKLDKAAFDQLPDDQRARILRDIDTLAAHLSPLPPADRQRAADLHTRLRGSKPPPAPSGPARPAAGTVDRALHDAQHGTGDEVQASVGDLTLDQVRKMSQADTNTLLARLQRVGGADAGAMMWTLRDPGTHSNPDAKVARVAQARLRVDDAIKASGSAKDQLDVARKLTVADLQLTDDNDRADLLKKLSRLSSTALKPEDVRDSKALYMVAYSTLHSTPGKPEDTLEHLANAARAKNVADVHGDIDKTLTNLRNGQVPLERALQELEAYRERAKRDDTLGDVQARAWDLAERGTDLPPAARVALAHFRMEHDKTFLPAPVRLATMYATQRVQTPGSASRVLEANLAGAPGWLREALHDRAAGVIREEVRSIGQAGSPSGLVDIHRAALLGLAPGRDYSAELRSALRESADNYLNRGNGTIEGYALAQELIDRLNGKSVHDYPHVVQSLIDLAQTQQVHTASDLDKFRASPLSSGLTKEMYDKLPAGYQSAIALMLFNINAEQRRNKQPLTGESAAEIISRISGQYPDVSGLDAQHAKAVITATLNADVAPEADVLKDLSLLDSTTVDNMLPKNRAAIRKALSRLASSSDLGARLDTRGRYQAQYELDELSNHFNATSSVTPYKVAQMSLISRADPDVLFATTPGSNARSQFLDRAEKVDKAGFDSLPAPYRDQIEASLGRIAADSDAAQAARAQAVLATFKPSYTPPPTPTLGNTTGPAMPRTKSTDPKVSAALDTIYGDHAQAGTVAHQLKTYGALKVAQFNTLNLDEQQQVMADLAYIAATSKGANAARAAGYISRFSPPGTPLGSTGPGVPIPPAGSVVGQTILPTPQDGLLREQANRGPDGGEWTTLSNGKRVWGKYGAAGLLLAHDGPDGKRRYLMVQRGPSISDPGKWHYPGGAIDGNETAYTGGTREVLEELGFDPAELAKAKVYGYHEASQPGWKYTSIVATVDKPLVPHLKGASHGGETADAQWLAIDEIRKLDADGKLLGPLAGGAFERNVASVLPPAKRTIGQVATPTKRPPRLVAPPPTRHKQVRGKDLVTDKATRDQLRRDVKATRATYAGKSADDRLAAIGHMQGYDQLPTVVSKDEMDRLLATGDYIEAWRGVRGTGGKTAKQIHDDLRYGVAYYGKGIFGNGYYLATQKRVAEGYSDYTPGSVVRILIPKSAVTQVHSDVIKGATKYGTATSKSKGTEFEDSTLWDEGRYAAAIGLDGIEIPVGQRGRAYGAQSGHVAAPGKPAYNWLNRATLIVQED